MSDFTWKSHEFKMPSAMFDQPICVYNPNWFSRIFLRRKPVFRTLRDSINECYADMERQMGLSLYMNGKKDE